ncbi:MAG: hypothetical protein ACE5KJ_08795, partial [Candidatus Zixiibacteriota bacterium]
MGKVKNKKIEYGSPFSKGGRMKLKITFVLLIAGLVFTLGISCPPKEYLCDPSQQGGPKMKMEYDYQEGYRLDDF